MLLHSLGQAVGADRHRNPPPDRRDVAQAPWTHMAQLCCMDAPQCPRLTARQGAALRGTEPLNPQGFAISQRGFLFPRGKGTIVHSEASFHGTEWGPTADFGRHRTLGLPIAPCCCQSPAAPAGPPFSLSRAFSPRSMSPGTPHPTRTDRRSGRAGSSRRSRSALRRRQGLPSARGPHGCLGPELRRAPLPAPPRPRPGPARRGGPQQRDPGSGRGVPAAVPSGGAGRGGAARRGGSGYTSCPLRAEPSGGAGHGGEVSAAAPPVEGRGRAEPRRGWGRPSREPPSCPGRSLSPVVRSRLVNRRSWAAAALGPAVGAPRVPGEFPARRGSGCCASCRRGAAGIPGFTWARSGPPSSPTPRGGSVAVPNRPVPKVPRPRGSASVGFRGPC